ncbi:hypothetical protein [Corynebacterium pilosum]|nr:hypothetical protein [Corynebacterium pilosum]
MVVSTGLIIPSSLMFPGPAALLPVGGPASRLLETAPAPWAVSGLPR